MKIRTKTAIEIKTDVLKSLNRYRNSIKLDREHCNPLHHGVSLRSMEYDAMLKALENVRNVVLDLPTITDRGGD